MKQKIIAQGAEATILQKDNLVTKHRIKKSYRHPELDQKIRKQRTKRESKLLEKASRLIPIPKIKKTSLSDYTIQMQHIKGKKLSKSLDSLPNALQICSTIGKQIAILHDNNIIHGDLTTSNMILSDTNEIYFIDFGLGFISNKPEDKAVDLHLIKQALEAKHFKHFKPFFNTIIKTYKKQSKNSTSVLKRLEKVEARGRYKTQF